MERQLKPPPKLNIVEWADTYRKLNPELSSTPGTWKTENVEVARGPMLAVSQPDVHTVSVMACTQLLKTELINNVIGFHIHQDPAPMLLIQPTTKLGEAWSKDRLDKMRRDTVVVKERVKEARSRDGGTTILHKDFYGGHLTIVGANSPVDLASRPIRVVMAARSTNTRRAPARRAIRSAWPRSAQRRFGTGSLSGQASAVIEVERPANCIRECSCVAGILPAGGNTEASHYC